MIKYVFFDWGYTLIQSFEDVDSQIEEVLKPHGKTWKEIFKVWRNYHYLHSLGRVENNTQKYQQISLLTGVPVSALEKIGELLLESHILDTETKQTIFNLKNKGYHLGIISNNIDEDVKHILLRENIFDAFDTVVCSSTVGERKPSAKIFLEAFKNIPKNEYSNILFVSDELAEDIIGAKALGTKTCWLNSKTVNLWRKQEPEIFETDHKIDKIADLNSIL